MFWGFFYCSTCEEEYISDFLSVQRLQCQAIFGAPYNTGSTCAEVFCLSWSGCAMPDEYVTVFFLSAQLVVETVEESVRGSASWVF